ncbi:MAG: hypothetical protein RMK52_08010 [Chitinophagales bacterium]|nr:hypothetical protein [Chitinophagales bacterium]MDW8394174.1 hypothetical protein [Chitinophagales bacterium]
MEAQLLPVTDEQGRACSPVLPPGKKNFLIDIDGTITDDIPNEQPERMRTCLPFPDAVQTIRQWFQEGHFIYFFTSRTEDLRPITEAWLQQHQIPYHGIVFGKPRGGNYHWIDNHIVRATRFKGRFGQLVRREHTIEVFEE